MSADFQLFPILDPATENALRASIERWGVLVPIVKDQHGAILDGHHRARIADDLKVDYQTTRLVLDDDADRLEIARTLNADRRQMDAPMRRQVEADLRAKGHSLRAIAGAVGVSKNTVVRDLGTVPSGTVPGRVVGLDGKSRPAKVQVKNRRDDQRAQQALDTGVTLPSTVIDTKRLERIARETEADRRRAEPIPAVSGSDIQIRHGDFRTVLDDIEPGTVDAIITDPPYAPEYIDLFDDLGRFAARALKPDGLLAVMVGCMSVPQYLDRLAISLRYRWIGAYLTSGPRTRVYVPAVGTGWKPILMFQRHDATPRFLNDDVFVSAADDKTHHHWGQSESGMAALVERLSRPDALVVDPFLGGGTTAVVCRDLGRRFIGCDTDAAAVTTSRERTA